MQCTWVITLTSLFTELFPFVKMFQKFFFRTISQQVFKVLQWNFIHLYRALGISAVRMVHNSYFLIYRVIPLCQNLLDTFCPDHIFKQYWRDCNELLYIGRWHWGEVQCTWFITLTFSFTEIFPFVKLFCPDNIFNCIEGISMKIHTLIGGIEVKCSEYGS